MRCAMNIAIIGANGGIGNAFVQHYIQDKENNVFAFSRGEYAYEGANCYLINYDSAGDLEEKSNLAEWDIVIVAIGLLGREPDCMPEKTYAALSQDNMLELYRVNAIFPSLCAKAFIPRLKKNNGSVFAVLSARVGSISDNHLGGWHSYRASKAALNMLIKNFSIEHHRKDKSAIIVGLHPGTVDTNLSRAFQKNVSPDKLFSAEQAVGYLVKVINELNVDSSGLCLAWDGQEIPT